MYYTSLIFSAITEVDEIMNGKDSVDHEDIDKMTYITSVLEETLRLYPIAPAVDKFSDIKNLPLALTKYQSKLKF